MEGGGNILIFDSINKTEEEFLPSLSLRSEESSKFKYERSSWRYDQFEQSVPCSDKMNNPITCRPNTRLNL